MRFNLAAALCLLTIAPSWGATRSNSGFEIILYFSPKAAQELAFTGQDVAVDAMFYGDPAKAFASKADNMGRIALGEEKVINSPSVSVVRDFRGQDRRGQAADDPREPQGQCERLLGPEAPAQQHLGVRHHRW